MTTAAPWRLVPLACLGLALCLLVSACGLGPTKAEENFGKVEFRMTEAQVTDLLGPPTETTQEGDRKTWVWKHSTGHVQVTFQNGVVVQKGGKTTKQH